jgi:hypothetical protein
MRSQDIQPEESFRYLEVEFIDDLGAAASVITDEPTEREIIADDQIDALLAPVPGFATRFYVVGRDSGAAPTRHRLAVVGRRLLTDDNRDSFPAQVALVARLPILSCSA